MWGLDIYIVVFDNIFQVLSTLGTVSLPSILNFYFINLNAMLNV